VRASITFALLAPAREIPMIEDFIERASVFQSPSDLGALFNEHCATISKHDLFNKPENNNVLPEVWTAAMLGLGFQRGTGVDVKVRICGGEPFPDFRLLYGGHDLAFETTVALLDTPEGKPGIVYRDNKSLGPISSGKRIESPPFDYGPLETAIQKKTKKYYSSPVHLCVYVPYGGKGFVFDEVVRSTSMSGGNSFESVWVLTHTHMTCAKQWDQIGGPGGWIDLPVMPIHEEQK